jgi:hypothetical protein
MIQNDNPFKETLKMSSHETIRSYSPHYWAKLHPFW